MAKKMLSLLLALMMLYSLAVPAWAEATQTETPAPTETTAPTEEPVPTETPAPTETLAQTEEPVPTETIAPTEEPVPTETPAQTEKPVQTETPVQTEEPVPTETPAQTEEPAQPEEPVEETEDAESTGVVAAAADQTVASDETRYAIVNLKDNTGENISITQADGTPFVSGDKVPMQPSGNYELYLVVQGDPDAYYIEITGKDGFRFGLDGTGRLKLALVDGDQDGQVTVTLIKRVQLKLGENAEQIAYVSGHPLKAYTYPTYRDGDYFDPRYPFYAAVKEGYALVAEGATAEPDTGFYGGGYYVDNAGAVTRIYRVRPAGSGPVTLSAVPATEKAPVPWPVTYTGEMEAYPADLRYYDFPGEFFYIELNPGYAASVNGGPLQSPTVEVRVGEGGKAVVEAVKLASGAKLVVNGETSALVRYELDRGYLLDGDTIPNGNGYLRLSEDYTVTDAEGGIVTLEDATSGGIGMSIYKHYHVQALADTVTITVEEAARPAEWLELTPYNDYPDRVEVSTDSEYLFGAVVDGRPQDIFWYISVPERENIMTVTLNPAEVGGSVAGFKLEVLMGGQAQLIEDHDSFKVYRIEVDEGEIYVHTRVVLEKEPAAQAPGEPTASAPGLTDQAGTEKQLTEQTTALVDAALKGQPTTGVTEAEAAAIAAAAAKGQTITTQLVAQLVEAPADADAIVKAAGDSATVARYVDAEIRVQADGETIGRITQTEEPIELAVTLSKEELDKGLIFFVVRSHEGKTDILPARLDGTTLLFSTDKFSSFGVAYTDDIAFAQVEPIPDQKWTGAEVKPSVKVTANGRELKEGTDYELKYEDNIHASDKAKVIITGKAPYTGSQELTFKIVKPATANGPATGDQTPLALYVGLMSFSLAGLSLSLGRKRRAEK